MVVDVIAVIVVVVGPSVVDSLDSSGADVDVVDVSALSVFEVVADVDVAAPSPPSGFTVVVDPSVVDWPDDVAVGVVEDEPSPPSVLTVVVDPPVVDWLDPSDPDDDVVDVVAVESSPPSVFEVVDWPGCSVSDGSIVGPAVDPPDVCPVEPSVVGALVVAGFRLISVEQFA